jgi:hypothetical protein
MVCDSLATPETAAVLAPQQFHNSVTLNSNVKMSPHETGDIHVESEGTTSSCLQLPGTRLFALRNEVTIAVDPIPILDQFLVRQRMRQRG